MTTRCLAAFAVGTVVVLGIAGCGSSSPKSSASKSSGASNASAEIGTIMSFTYFPAGLNANTQAGWNGMHAAAAELRGKASVQFKWMGSLENDAGAYLNYINTALVQKPAGVIIIPNDATAMAAGLKRIAATGTKVILTDESVPGFTPESIILIDNKAAGADAGEYLVAQQKAGKLVSNQVAILGSTPGITSTDDRVAGFKQAIAGSGLKIVVTLEPTCTAPEAGRTAMADVLSAHPKLGAVFSVCDTIALGAAKAIQAANRLSVQQVATDGSTPGIQTLEAGKGINAEIAQNFYTEDRLAVLVAEKAVAGETVPRTVYVPLVRVTKANAAAYLATITQETAK
jgi:ribose transport system substrate-binding protein